MAISVFSKGKPKRRKRRETKAEVALKKRGSEALGFLLVVVGLLFAALLFTYSPADPSFSTATDAPVQNLLGVAGSYIADPLHKALGWAAFGIPVAFLVWGGRMVLHRGQERAMWRVIFVPLAIALTATFAATHVPPYNWNFEYGLGGIFGDVVLGSAMSVLPGGVNLSLLVITLVLAAVGVVLTVYALGMNWRECKACSRGMWQGFVTAYSGLRWLVSKFWTLTIPMLTFLGVKGLKAAQNARQTGMRKVAEAKERRQTGEVQFSGDGETHVDDGVSSRMGAKIAAVVQARKDAKTKITEIPAYGKAIERVEPSMSGATDDPVVDDYVPAPVVAEPAAPRVQHP
ncbi:MAG: DNA translocase FtsK 4TM domain-containing protein, partial [Alphaproteobacteria bacterium]